MQGEMDYFLSSDLVNVTSGMSVGGVSVDPNFDASLASGAYTEVVKSNRRALDLLGLGANACEDILITTENVLLLMRMLGQDYYLGLAISRRGNLGLARAIMNKYSGQLLDVVHELES
jgi:predicted regulator of Ras-like GTPase activity (Roadblock/LC7/MglB family)